MYLSRSSVISETILPTVVPSPISVNEGVIIVSSLLLSIVPAITSVDIDDNIVKHNIIETTESNFCMC